MNKTNSSAALAGTLFLILLIIPIVHADFEAQQKKQKSIIMDFKIHSPSFNEGEPIPARHGYYKGNISPPLNWTSPPAGTKSFALVVNDPDAPVGDWIHWIVFNISCNSGGLEENASAGKRLPEGAVEGLNDFKKSNYGGPCPPSGIHRYIFTLYALDCLLPLKENTTKNRLTETMTGHVLAKTILTGTYKSGR